MKIPRFLSGDGEAIRPKRDGVFAGLSVFAAILVCIGWIDWRGRRHEIQEVRGDLGQMATIAASQINGDLHATLRSAEQVRSAEYRATLDPLVRLHRALPQITYLYTVILVGDEVRFVLDTSTAGNEALGTTRTLTPSKVMDLYEKPDAELVAALQDRQVHSSRQPYHDEFGVFLSGFAPFYDSAGRFGGIVGVDQSVADLEDRLASNRHIEISAAFGGGLISFAIGAALWGVRRRSLRFEVDRQRAADALVASEQRYREAAYAAQAADRAKSDFLAVMSHEIRTPLNGVLGFNELLTHTELTPQQRELISIAQGCGRALLTLIDDILIFSKIESGQIELEQCPFDLRACLDDVLEVCAAPLGDKEIELCGEIAPGVPRFVCGDVTRLRQVLFNLVANAVKFTPKGDVFVRVSLANREHGVPRILFEVHDNGPGIPADRLHRLFQPFSQADSSTTRRYGGTGLGLAICRRLVEAMEGQIGVRTTVGEGSTFYFTIPARVAEEPTSSPPLQSYPGRKVLLVEGKTVARRLRKVTLEAWAIRCEAVEDLQTARLLWRNGARFDAIIVAATGRDAAAEAEELTSFCCELDPAPPCLLHLPLSKKESFAGLRLPPGSTVLGRPMRHEHLQQALTTAWRRATPLPEKAIAATRITPIEGAGQLHILVAEDLPTNQLLVKALLEKLGCAVDLVENGVAAVQQSAERPYDLILMDLQMPEMDGLEAAALIRVRESTEPCAHATRIIALTASAFEGERERCLAAGMNDYLVKPLNFARLKGIVAATVSDLALTA